MALVRNRGPGTKPNHMHSHVFNRVMKAAVILRNCIYKQHVWYQTHIYRAPIIKSLLI